MGTALVTSTGKPSKLLQQLLDKEKLINEAAASAYEDFFVIGRELAAIKHRPDLMEAAGFKSWNAYASSGRVLLSRQQADTYIAAATVRPKLPAISGIKVAGAPATWSLNIAEQFARCETARDIQSAARKLITYCNKNNCLPNDRLARKIVDEQKGEPRKRAKKLAKKLEAASLPHEAIEAMIANNIEWHTFLSLQDDDWWADAEDASPGIVGRLTEVLDEFASYLRS